MKLATGLQRLRAKIDALARDPLSVKLARGGFAAVVIKFGAAGLSFLMFLALARAMSVAEFGRFGFAFSLATVLAVAGSFGMRTLVLRFASIYEENKDAPHLHGVIRTGYLAVLLGCGVLGAALALLAAAWPGLESRSYLMATGIFTVILGLAEYQAYLLRVFGGMTLALAPRDIIWRGGVIAIATLASFSLLPQLDAASALWTLTGTLLLVVLGQAFAHPVTRPTSLLRAPAAYKLKDWLKDTKWLWGSSVLQVALPNLSIVVLGLILSPDRTGGFFAAWRLAMLLSLFHLAASMVASPLISRHFHRKEMRAIQTIATLTSVAASLPCIGIFVIFALAGDSLLGLFNPAYAERLDVLLILAAGYLVHVLFGPTAEFAEMSGHQDVYFRALAVITPLALLLIYPASYYFGEVGAAVVITASTVIWNAYVYSWVLRRYEIHLSFPISMAHKLCRGRKPF